MKQFIGPGAITPYGSYIARLIFPDLATLIPVLLYSVNLTGTMLTSFLLARLGRKPILQTGVLSGIIALILVTIGFFIESEGGNVIVIVGLFIWMISVGSAIFPISWLYIAEIVEPTFITIPTMINWFSAVIITILFPILEEAITAGPVFAFFAVYCLVFWIINQKLLI